MIPFVPLAPHARQAFSYTAEPDVPVQPGMLVRVPFGPRMVRGLVLRRGRPPRGASLKRVSGALSRGPLFSVSELEALEELAERSLESFALLAKSAALVREPMKQEMVEVPSHSRGRRTSARILVSWEPIAAVLPHALRRPVLILAPEAAIARAAVDVLTERGLSAALFAQGLRRSQRRDILLRLLRGEALAVVATHPGIFLPFPSLKSIIVLETALASHRQWDLHPRYDARIGALLLARTCGVPLTFQSTLPSLDLQALDRSARTQRRRVPPAPKATVIRRSTSDPILSDEALHALRDAHDRGETVFLFHDIVGTERVFACDTCGAVLRCPLCLGILERDGASLRCRVCGASAGRVPNFCPRCRSPHIAARRVGTSQIEHELRRRFPGAAVTRADRETLPRTEPAQAGRPPTGTLILGSERAFAILQPRSVDRILVVDADRILEEPRFDADERFLTVIARLAALVRTQVPLVLQTTHPNIRIMQALSAGTVTDWLQAEADDHRTLRYPPFAALLKIERVFPTEARARRAVDALLKDLPARMPRASVGSRVRGTFPATRTSGPTAEVVFRGPLDALRAVQHHIPSGWSTDPIIPIALLAHGT